MAFPQKTMTAALIAATLLLTMPGVAAVSAQSAATPSPRPTVGSDLAQKLDSVRRARIEQFWGKMRNVFVAATERLEQIADRIASRIAKFEAHGADVGASREKLDAARAKLAEARGDLDAADAAVESMLGSDHPREAFPAVREKVSLVKKDLRDAHALLVEAVRILRGVSTAVKASPQQSPAGETPSGND